MTTFAESSATVLVGRDVTATMGDGTTPTAHTLVLRAASLSITPASHTPVQGVDENGDPIGYVRKGPQNGATTIEVSGPISAIGGDSGETGLAMLANRDVSNLTGWTSTTASDIPGGTFNLTVTFATVGAITGATHTFTKCYISGGSLTKSLEGFEGSLTISTPDAVAAIS